MNPPIPNFYDPENARQLVHFAAASYLSLPFHSSHVIENKATDTRVAIYQLTEQDLVVAFRGTHSLRNLVTDLRARRVPLLHGGPSLEVHQGFQLALNSVRGPLLNFLQDAAARADSPRIWFTGHSLGAALAKLFAAGYPGKFAGVYTFGEPRVGNAAFRDFYDALLRSKTFRVVDGEDFITRLPWWLGAFRHCGTEIFYDSLGRAHIAPPWWVKGPSDVFGAWAEWRREGRLALLNDHHVNRYVEMLSVPNPNLNLNPNLPSSHSEDGAGIRIASEIPHS